MFLFKSKLRSIMRVVPLIFIAVVLSVSQLLAGPPAAKVYDFSIPAGPLESVLNQFVHITGTNLSYVDEFPETTQSAGVNGRYTAETALQTILGSTGITAKQQNGGGFLLQALPQATEKQPTSEQQKNKTEAPELQQTRMEINLGELMVTANKVEEDIQKVPQSITVIDDEILKEKGIKDLSGIINEIPNMTPFGGSSKVSFRGLTQSYYTSNNPVVIYIDGVGYSNSNAFEVSMNNVERIEVLRGPQGTLYGKDAIGAVIKVVTKEPTNEWHGSVGTEYGSYNDMEGSFNVSGPLLQDKLYLGLNARYQQDDGWVTNDYTGDDKAGESSEYNLGGNLLFTPTDRFSAKLVLSNDSYDNNWGTDAILSGGTDASEFDRDDAEHVSYDVDTYTEKENWAQSLELKIEFDSMTLGSTTTHKDFDTEYIGDKDRMSDSVYDGLAQFINTDCETWAEELRLSSKNTEGVRWVAGAYFESEDIERNRAGQQFYRSGVKYELNGATTNESETMALFGQSMIPFIDNFELTLGGRYQYIDKEMTLDQYIQQVGSSSAPYFSNQMDETWSAFLFKVALSYSVNDNWNTYASVAQGYMPGGFNYWAGDLSDEDNTFEPQKSINYEIGVKGDFNRGRLAAAIFYMDIEDTQIPIYDEEQAVWATGNADSAHSLGAELELTYFLTDNIEVTAALGIIDAEYDDYNNGVVDFHGESITDTPSHSARLGIAYFNPNGFYARGDVMNMGKVPYYDDADDEFNEVDGYTVANVKIGYRFKGYDIYAYCKNLTDEEYITNFTSASAVKSVAGYGDPRTFGIGVRYSF
ncbi:TonB-dependent receptor [uncultured Desulfobacter sp.]|uniref:TonB-dependent receptor n=1 Tax=uncultured Desulfobacter sp. TaxID=240139 RepID=UPI0029F48E4E|nr:TonB-dependent receptor [uncultured Desulfobacter sp.]